MTGESLIVAQCLEWLALSRIFAFRNNTGALKDESGRLVKFGFPGSSDIYAIAAGTLVCIEVKTATGKQRKQQKLFQAMVERAGAVYLLVRSLEDLKRAFREHPSLATLGLHV